jgi:hypothetical protein
MAMTGRSSGVMGYRLLGLVVWRAGKWYARRRFGGVKRKIAIAGVSAAVIGGVVVAGRAAASSSDD